jgi:hypothetical protein
VPEVLGVLAKPFEFDRLQRRIEEALGEAAARRSAAARPAASGVEVLTT